MKIILAARDTDLRLALQLLLSEEPGVHVIGSASNVSGLLALINSTRPDLVIVDRDLPGPPIQEVLAEIGACETPPVIVLLGTEASLSVEISQASVNFYLQKGEPPEKLLEAFRQIVLDRGESDN